MNIRCLAPLAIAGCLVMFFPGTIRAHGGAGGFGSSGHSILSYRPTVGRMARKRAMARRQRTYQQLDYVFHHLTPEELKEQQENGEFGGPSRLHEMIASMREERRSRGSFGSQRSHRTGGKKGRHRKHRRR